MTNLPVLIVEDEPDGQEVLVGILDCFNIPSHVTSNAEEARDYLAEHQCAGVIIDLSLPGMDGLSLLKAIRSNTATFNIPCAIVTAFHSSLVKKQAVEAGCDAFIAKPFQEKYLVQEVQRMIAARG